MFWEGEQEALTVQFLQFIDWKTKDPPPPQIIDELLSVVGTVDIVGLHLLTHILKQYYFEMCHVLTLELDLHDITQQNNDENTDEQTRKKLITESVLIVTKLCSVICKMPNLQSLHLSFNHFPPQCYNPCIQMFNIEQSRSKQTREHKNNDSSDNDHYGYLFSGGNDVFPSLQQIFLNSSIFYANEENDDFITAMPIDDYNISQPTNGYWSDDHDTDLKNEINIRQLMTDYNISQSHNTNNSDINTGHISSWQCSICTLINNHEFMECNACGEPRVGMFKHRNANTVGYNPEFGPHFFEDEEVDDEKLLSMDDDEKSIYWPFINFLATHQTLKSASIHVDKRGKNGISLVNRILLSVAKRKTNLESFYIDCDALHLNYCCKYLVLAIKQHSFKRFSSHFFATDDRSVSKVIGAFNEKPHTNLTFLSIHGQGVQSAGQSIVCLTEFVSKHKDLEYLKLCYFSGVCSQMNGNINWDLFINTVLQLQTLCFIAFGELLIDDNAIMNGLCHFVQRCTTLQSIDISISQKSYEGHGGSLENTKKFIFYTFKNQLYLQEQMEQTETCLESYWKMPTEIVDLVVMFSFDMNGRLNININGLPDGDISDVGHQFIKLKQVQSRNWRINRDLQLFTHL